MSFIKLRYFSYATFAKLFALSKMIDFISCYFYIRRYSDPFLHFSVNGVNYTDEF